MYIKYKFQVPYIEYKNLNNFFDNAWLLSLWSLGCMYRITASGFRLPCMWKAGCHYRSIEYVSNTINTINTLNLYAVPKQTFTKSASRDLLVK